MPHSIALFLGKAIECEAAFVRPDFLGSVVMNCDLIATPLVPELHFLADAGSQTPQLCGMIDPLCERISEGRTILLAQTDIHGGYGYQAAMMWKSGRLVGRWEHNDDFGVATLDAPQRSINIGLMAAFGIWSLNVEDAFSRVGLERPKSTSEYVSMIGEVAQ